MSDHDGDPNWYQRFRKNLKRWYAKHGRDLPWRRSHDAYRIWISEIMLQQTTVAAVIPYFERFMSRFPDVVELAAAREEEVLQYWEGLGYYSRARNLHRSAKLIAGEHAGCFPKEVANLQSLPGVGRYTAGAISSFAFDQRAPIVEANTLRLYSRLLGYRGDPRSVEGQRFLWQFAEDVLPRKSPGEFNQALMELGATLCTPKEPGCGECPVRSCCRAFAEKSQAEIPSPVKRVKITAVTEAYVAVRREDQFLLLKRRPGERWAGLWDFPRYTVDETVNSIKPIELSGDRPQLPQGVRGNLEQQLAAQTGVGAQIVGFLSEIHHSVTRYRIRLLCLPAEYESGELLGPAAECRWFTTAQFDDLPFSMTGRRFAKILLATGSQR